MEIFAAFVLAEDARGIAATTRDDGRIGLPGGKVDKDENPFQAAVRESNEEGWNLLVSSTAFKTDMVDGKWVQWYRGVPISPLQDYKEKNRGIRPIFVDRKAIENSGFGNEDLFQKN